MWIRLSEWMHRVSTGWTALAALVVFLLFTALVLPAQAARAEADTGGAGSPDLSFFYTADELYQMAEAYGAAGRAAYVRARFTFDAVWPAVYTLFLGAAISWLSRRASAPGSRWRRANLAPVGGALFDYLENVSTSLVMLRYPSPTPAVDSLAAVCTLAKWLLVYASFGLLAAFAAAALWRRLHEFHE